MKTLNVMNVKEDDVLSRNEMKTIVAGSGSGSPDCTCNYSSGSSNCQVTVDSGSMFGTQITVSCLDGFYDSWYAGSNQHGTVCGGECSY
ncbi:hypothetical protein LQ318_04905 [Aliifodinibius salicampi]|uniref:Uncharacterized protein n=1 Tax=Fodinibius salicampi TaxID=1920655 RepID=A0ABT3PWL2_9BACT|nr:hypothetical protein [Fodinibius salicampi]MCW9712241.1 hypothetical protein [Fodinibius salicampi]